MSSKFPSCRTYTDHFFWNKLKATQIIGCDNIVPPDQELDYLLSSITVVLDLNKRHYEDLQHYEDFIILHDFNESEHNRKMQSFLNQRGFKNTIKNKACFKSLDESYIDVILTSRPNYESVWIELTITIWWFIQCFSQPTLS